MLIVHPAFPGPQRCRETTSHLDIVPTVVAMTGKSTTPVADTMARMKGKDLTPLLRQPVNPAFTQARGGVLFCYSQLMVHDPGFTKFLYETLHNKQIAKADHLRAIELFPIDWSLRVAIRSITDERYRFTRYFPFRAFNTPTTLGRSARQERSRALRPAQRSRRGYKPRLRLRRQPRPDRVHEHQAECPDRRRDRRRRRQLPAVQGFRRLGHERPASIFKGARASGPHHERARARAPKDYFSTVAASALRPPSIWPRDDDTVRSRPVSIVTVAVMPARSGGSPACGEQAQLHRQALHHLDPVARGVLRRQDRELRAGRRADALDHGLPGHVGIGVEHHRGLLADPHVGQLGLLEVGLDPRPAHRRPARTAASPP